MVILVVFKVFLSGYKFGNFDPNRPRRPYSLLLLKHEGKYVCAFRVIFPLTAPLICPISLSYKSNTHIDYPGPIELFSMSLITIY